MTSDRECMLCGGHNFGNMPYYYDYQGKRLWIVRCEQCGLSTLNPMLSREEVLDLYKAEYFEKDYHCGVLERPYAQEVNSLREEFRPYLREMMEYQRKGRYLEVGCAGGAMLAEARDLGFETIGVELSKEMADWGRKNFHLDIRYGELEAQNFPTSSFDIVFLGDVIEHLLTPKNVLTEIHRVLAPGGIIGLAYPTELNSLSARLRRTIHLKKRSPHKPYHLFYYDLETMHQLLNQCNFVVLRESGSKLVRSEPLLLKLMDIVNQVVTKSSGKWGDRGLTIARAGAK